MPSSENSEDVVDLDPLGASRKSTLVTGSRVVPDFSSAGAPEWEPRALYDFLGQHPDIFLPRTKELLLFATDLSYPTRLSHDEFVAHFSEPQRERRCRHRTPAYPQSRCAAEEIYAHRPDADIIVCFATPSTCCPPGTANCCTKPVEEPSKTSGRPSTLSPIDGRDDGSRLTHGTATGEPLLQRSGLRVAASR